MPRQRLDNYLRTHRLKWGLSLQELADLLGVCKDTVSKYELGHRSPSATRVLALEIIFGVSETELFPTLCKKIEDDLGIRALELDEKLSGLNDRKSIKKRKLLGGIPERLPDIPEP